MKHDDIGFLIKQIADRIQAQVDAELKCSELTYSQFHVLAYLAHHDMAASQKEIEEFLGVSHPTVVGLIARLESKGFVETAVDENDKRKKRIRMTDKAVKLGESMRGSHAGFEEKLRSGLSGEEAAELIRLLSIVYGNLGGSECSPEDIEGKGNK